MRDYAVLRSDLKDDLQMELPYLTSDMDIPAANALWISNSFWKKFQDEIDQGAESACLALFITSNAKCADFAFRSTGIFDDMLINEVKTSLDNQFHRGPDLVLTTEEIFRGMNIGPGASIDVDSYNFYTKLFDSTLTCTDERLYRLYRSAISGLPTWLSAENARHKVHGNRIVVGNRLSFVPKTAVIARSICTEPLLNMVFQKGIGSALERILKAKFKINLSTQPMLNRQLARKGSIDGSYGTIDLSSASDSISLRLLKEILPPYVYRWLELTRSPKVIFPDGSEEQLHMVSSMGNGFTFPLQTLLFSTIVTSCYRILGIKTLYSSVGPTNFAVFGDDIIVRKDAYDFVVHALSLFGFTVNADKSFNCGYFRESCGGDFFRGHDIRGVYLKSLKTSADVYSAINRIIRWSARTGILLPRVVARLRSWVKFLPIPYADGDAEGIKVPFAPASLRRDRNTSGIVYYALSAKPLSMKLPPDAASDWSYHRYGRKGRKAFYNPDGLIVSLVGGYISNGKIPLRSEKVSFNFRRRVTSQWRSPVNTFFSDRIEKWTRNTGILARTTNGLYDVKSITAPTSVVADMAGSSCLRDDWEIIAELYLG